MVFMPCDKKKACTCDVLERRLWHGKSSKDPQCKIWRMPKSPLSRHYFNTIFFMKTAVSIKSLVQEAVIVKIQLWLISITSATNINFQYILFYVFWKLFCVAILAPLYNVVTIIVQKKYFHTTHQILSQSLL